jgi:hypothetical protein
MPTQSRGHGTRKCSPTREGPTSLANQLARRASEGPANLFVRWFSDHAVAVRLVRRTFQIRARQEAVLGWNFKAVNAGMA